MLLTQWFRSLRQPRGRVRRRRAGFLPRVEQLEDRSVPSLTPVSAGSLDPTFGTGGKIIAPFSRTGDSISTVALQSNGQIIAGGSGTAADGTPDSIFARYNADGTLDARFGSGGFIRTDFGVMFQASAIALAPDGDIVLAGVAIGPGGDQDFALAEYTSNGVLDTSFGHGGWLTTDFHGNADWAFGLAIQPNGQIVAAGLSYHANGPGDFALARYNPDGSLDTHFGQDGLVTTNFGDQFYDVAYGLTLQPNAQIVVAGFSESSSGRYRMALARYNSDGSLDAHFGQGGLVTNDFGSNLAVAKTVSVQPNGAILVGGWAQHANTGNDFALARYNPDGSRDTGFGHDGLVTTDIAGSDDYLFALAVQPDGKILAAGTSELPSTNFAFALARYNADGSLDTGFGTGGRVTTSFGGDDDESLGIAPQSDGSILAIGEAGQNNTTQFAIARYVGNANEIYVDNLYQLLLHRPADPDSAYWVHLLVQGYSPAVIVQGIEQSPEYLNAVVTGLYEHYLQRSPDAGSRFWLVALENGATIEQVIDGIVSSPEFFQDEAGGTDAGYVRALYQDVLGRGPDPGDESAWLAALHSGRSRAAAAAGFLASHEYQADLVTSYYLQFLQRSADTAGQDAWVGGLQSGLADQAVLAGILGSQEGMMNWSSGTTALPSRSITQNAP